MKVWKRFSLFFFFVFLVVFIPFTVPVQTVESASEWILEKRGCNYDIYYNSTNPSQKKWVSAPQRVLNSTGHWVDYVFSYNVTEDSYVVKAGLIGAKIYPSHVEFYSPNLTRLAVWDEHWIVWKYSTLLRKWVPILTQTKLSFDSSSYIEADSYVNVTMRYSNAFGSLNITYHFRERLKHDVRFSPTDNGTYMVTQVWLGIVYDKVELQNQTILFSGRNVTISSADGATFLFFNDTQPFGVYESQVMEEKFVKAIIGNATFNGKEYCGASYIFGNWTLVNGESLIVDPDTMTLHPSSTHKAFFTSMGSGSNLTLKPAFPENYEGWFYSPTEFDSAQYDAVQTSDDNYASDLKGSSGLYLYHCSSFKFNISSVIDLNVYEVTNVTFTWEGYQTLASGNTKEYAKIQVNTTSGWSDVGDFGTTDTSYTFNNTEIPNPWVVNGWFKFGANFKHYNPDQSTDDYYLYVDFVELVITYEPRPTIGTFQAPSTVYANEYFFLNATINDGNGVADFKNCTVELSGNIILLWVNSTDNFTEYEDPSNYVTVYNGTRTQLNSTAYRLSWKLIFTSEYPVGQVDVIADNTKVYDSSELSNSNSQSNLFYFAGEEPSGGPSGGPGGVGPTPPEETPPVTPPPQPPAPPMAPGNLVVIGIIIIVGVVLFATVSGEEAPLLNSQKRWRKIRGKTKKVKWRRSKVKSPKWKRGKTKKIKWEREIEWD